jgi:hypothetical protein
MSVTASRTFTSEQIELFMHLFVNRRDIYARQYTGRTGHGYRAIREQLTDEVILSHLQGKETVGLYALGQNSTARWMVVDMDTTVAENLLQLLEGVRKLGLPEPAIESSGRRGYHFWWFFDTPAPGWQARKLGLAVSEGYEVFPKQHRVSADTSQPGSLVKAPLGIHQVSGNWSVFVGEDFAEVRDPWALLASVRKVDIDRLLPLLPQRQEVLKGRRRIPTPKTLRPCIERVLAGGASEGYRNEIGHLVACEMRRLGRPKEQAAGVLACWNLRNNPRLSRHELQVILDSAYSREPYQYSCSPDGRLRRILECVGSEKCPFAVAGEEPSATS